MQLIIPCKNSGPCHSWQHIGTNSSIECEESLVTNYMSEGIYGAFVLGWMSWSKHESSAQCIKGICADSRKCCHTPSQQKTCQKITLWRLMLEVAKYILLVCRRFNAVINISRDSNINQIDGKLSMRNNTVNWTLFNGSINSVVVRELSFWLLMHV